MLTSPKTLLNVTQNSNVLYKTVALLIVIQSSVSLTLSADSSKINSLSAIYYAGACANLNANAQMFVASRVKSLGSSDKHGYDFEQSLMFRFEEDFASILVKGKDNTNESNLENGDFLIFPSLHKTLEIKSLKLKAKDGRKLENLNWNKFGNLMSGVNQQLKEVPKEDVMLVNLMKGYKVSNLKTSVDLNLLVPFFVKENLGKNILNEDNEDNEDDEVAPFNFIALGDDGYREYDEEIKKMMIDILIETKDQQYNFYAKMSTDIVLQNRNSNDLRGLFISLFKASSITFEIDSALEDHVNKVSQIFLNEDDSESFYYSTDKYYEGEQVMWMLTSPHINFSEMNLYSKGYDKYKLTHEQFVNFLMDELIIDGLFKDFTRTINEKFMRYKQPTAVEVGNFMELYKKRGKAMNLTLDPQVEKQIMVDLMKFPLIGVIYPGRITQIKQTKIYKTTRERISKYLNALVEIALMEEIMIADDDNENNTLYYNMEYFRAGSMIFNQHQTSFLNSDFKYVPFDFYTLDARRRELL
jgi:hypothetical protein